VADSTHESRRDWNDQLKFSSTYISNFHESSAW